MAKKKAQQNISGIVITVIAALLAIAAVIFLIITITREEEDDEPEVSITTGFVPDSDFYVSVEQAAYNLLEKNFTAYGYLTAGMRVEEEPYGNLPEDGFYTCITDEFADFDEFSEYIHSIYIDAVAEKLLTDPFGNGPVYGYDQDGLGLSMDFTPSGEEGRTWDVQFACTPLSENECDLEVTYKDADGQETVKKIKLLLEGGEWKLSEMVS